jgi:hypothetical protein
MGLSYGRAGRLTAGNGDSWPGQIPDFVIPDDVLRHGHMVPPRGDTVILHCHWLSLTRVGGIAGGQAPSPLVQPRPSLKLKVVWPMTEEPFSCVPPLSHHRDASKI